MKKENKNQCDGCRLGLPLKGGIHVDPSKKGKWDYYHMLCTKYRYKKEGAK